MICPNCKTELVEVNGRYICSDCGREIPENEVMASDWGNGATARAGLYGAGVDDTPTDGSAAVTDYTASLSEIESEEIQQPVTPPVLENAMPASSDVITEAEPIIGESSAAPAPDAGYFAPEAVGQPTINNPQPTESVVGPESSPGPFVPIQNDVAVEPVPEPVAPEVQEIPIKTPEVLPTPQPIDPGIYTDPMYENPVPEKVEPMVSQQATAAPIPTGNRTNLIVWIVGIILVLLLLGGGIWGYLSLNQADDSVTAQPTPVVVAWQELQVVDGGFKIQFPGEPEKVEETQAISGTERTLVSYVYTEGDASYTAAFSALDPSGATAILASPETTLPQLVKELADTTSLTVSDTKVGKYYSADAIDFTLSDDTASYKGKIMVKGNTFILVKAGSESGQTVDYDKFIKSFSFIETAATGGAAE